MAITCNNCGYAYNGDDAERCTICAAQIMTANDDVNLPQGSELIEQNSDTAAPPSSQPTLIHNSRPGNQESEPSSAARSQSNQNTLDGRISHVERHDERPRTDVYKVMASILIGILVLIPYGTLFLISGMLSFVFALLGFSSLSQLFNPIIWTTSCFELLEVLVLRRMSRIDSFPIYRGMVEDNNGREYVFMLRGPLDLGNLVMGHHVRLLGEWRQGTFIARQGSDLTTETAIISGYRNPWRIIFFIVLCLEVMLGLGIFLYWQ